MLNICDPLFIFASLFLFLPSKTGLRVEVAVGVSIGVKYSYNVIYNNNNRFSYSVL